MWRILDFLLYFLLIAGFANCIFKHDTDMSAILSIFDKIIYLRYYLKKWCVLPTFTCLLVSYIFMSADLSVSWHYVVTLRRGRTRTRPREQLLLQNYKA